MEKLKNAIKSCKKINTHSHHMKHTFYNEIGINELLGSSYISWCGNAYQTLEQRKKMFYSLRNRSYFIWLKRALEEMYGLGEFNENTFLEYDNAIKLADKKDDSFLRLRNLCGYEHIVLDCYWNYGDNLGDKELFTPTFRINIFMNGYDSSFVDQDGYSILKFFQNRITNIDEYVLEMKNIIRLKVKNGCVALKCAIAYERGLNFYKSKKEDAQKILTLNKNEYSKKNIDDFQSYIFYSLCEVAAELDIPFQVHTGLGQIENTRAINLLTAIKDNPTTKFVLFHLSFPYLDDVLTLAHNFQNVYPDFCWVPLLSYNAAIESVNKLLDVVNVDKLCWGCDTWTVEESYGAVLAMDYVLENALSKRISDGFITEENAIEVVKDIYYNNAKRLYKL